jgi:hypothetical protein
MVRLSNIPLLGLIGAIFVHIGYNVYAWQYMYNQNLIDVVKKIRALQLIDIIHPVKIGEFLGSFIDDALSPFVLTYQTAKKVTLLLLKIINISFH